MQPRIAVVGSTMVDLIAYVSRAPSAGETVVGDDFRIGFGGKGANQAVAAARLGYPVKMIGRVGAGVNRAILDPGVTTRLDSRPVLVNHVRGYRPPMRLPSGGCHDTRAFGSVPGPGARLPGLRLSIRVYL